ncbi:Putative protein of unknown function [Podospora comata]|uniref:Mid2 domain-containing protein n=1 Tax=Podospora comata TaxID=48703 RepID=A0ABY6SAT1_PODCO|nr:Putative protein of unknown function [Podospora comata]
MVDRTIYILQYVLQISEDGALLRLVPSREMSDQSPTYLFRPARQALVPLSPSPSSSSMFSSTPSVTRTTASIASSTSLQPQRRQAAGTCRADESTCPQAGWCCNKDETCFLEAGAFFCCPTGAGKGGCVRVCHSGDFQCGGTTPDTTGICCANGQTCIGGDTPLPFCADTGASSSTRKTSTSLTTSQTSTPSHSGDSHTSSTTTSLQFPTPSPNNSPSFSTYPTHTISNIPSPSATEPPSSNSGISLAAQITAIIVPLVIITLIISCIFRCRRKKQRGTRIQSTDFTEQQNTSTGTTGTGISHNADGLSFYSAYSSYPKTPPPPPPTFSAGRLYGREAKEEDGEVMSSHERYMMESRMFRTPTPQSPVGQGAGRGL